MYQNDIKEQIVDLTFLNDGIIHTLQIDKEIKYKYENIQKQTLSTKQNITKSDLKLSYYVKYLIISVI